MEIKRWNGEIIRKREWIDMATMTKDMLCNMNISSAKINDFIKDNNENMKSNRKFLDKCNDIRKMFKKD